MEFKQNTLERQQSKLVIVKAKQLPHGQFEAILSTDDLDRHGEHVSVKGMVIPKRTLKMYYNHQTYGDHLPIGKWNKIWKKGEVLMGQGEVDLEDELAVKIYKKIENGFIDSISVGFYPQEYDGETSTWTKSELVEASVVAEPANVSAIITSKELGFTQEEFNASIKVKLAQIEPYDADPPEEPEPPLVPDSKDGAVDTEVKAAIEELKSRLGAVEQTLAASTESPAIKSLIRVRVAGKEVDKAAEQLNRVLRIKLKGQSDV